MNQKLSQWITELKELPADAALWHDLTEFLDAAGRVAAAKADERENAHSALSEALASLCQNHQGTLAKVGLVDLSTWTEASSSQPLRAVHELNALVTALQEYARLVEQAPASPAEFQDIRSRRNALEDEIVRIGGILTTIFAGGIPPEKPEPPTHPPHYYGNQKSPEVTGVEVKVQTNGEAPVTLAAVPSEKVVLAPPETDSQAIDSSPLEELKPSTEIKSVEPTPPAPAEVKTTVGVAQAISLQVEAQIAPSTETTTISIPVEVSTATAVAVTTEVSAPPSTDEDDSPERLDATGRRILRIFISSPGDVGQERLLAGQVIDRLAAEFSAYIALEPIFWEHEPLRATSHFQDQILAPSKCDIMVCILWARLGTRLPAHFVRTDGSLYDSGTEWEFEDALQSYQVRGTPDLMVYRKSAEPQASMSDEAALMQRLTQKRLLDSFIERWFGSAKSTFKAAFHSFPSPDEFEDLLENHLRILVRERLPEHTTADGSVALSIRWHKGSPFRGLESFDVEHAEIFCGRTRAISELKESLLKQATENRAFVVVFGMSGSGKSSVVRAGLLPTIIQPGVIDGVGLWRYAIFNPSDGTDLIESLASALLQTTALPEFEKQGLNANELAALFHEAPQRVLGPLRAALEAAAEKTAEHENLHQVPTARLAIVIDQMEEIWTEETSDDETRNAFMAAISMLSRSGMVWTIATMRSDFFPRCVEIPELMALKEGSGQYHLLPPTFAEMGQILNQPVRLAGLHFEVDPKTGNDLCDVLQEAAGKGHGALPLLQFTLDELFKRRTSNGVLSFAAYEELGGIEGALARRAEEVFEKLPPAVQNELPAVLRALVTVISEGDESEVQIAARRAPWATLAISPERRQLVDAFIDARLLISDGHGHSQNQSGASDGIVRVAHEALLRHWPRLQEWLAADMKFLRIRARVTTQTAHWIEHDRSPSYLLQAGLPLAEADSVLSGRTSELEPETTRFIQESIGRVRRARIIRRCVITGVTAGFFAVVSGFGGFSYMQWQESERQRNISETQKKKALAAIHRWTYDVPNKLAPYPATRPVLRTIFQENVNLLNDIMALDSNTPAVRREKASNLDHMGDTWFLLGDTPKATAAYDQSLGILTDLAKEQKTPARRRDLATGLEKIGDVRQRTGDLKGAKSAFTESLKIRVALDKTNSTPAIQRELAVSYEKIAAVQKLLENPKSSLDNLEKSWEIRSNLYKAKTNSMEARRDLLVSTLGLGDAYLERGLIDKANTYFEKVLPIAEENSQERTAEARRDLAAVYDRLADIQAIKGQNPKALEYMTKSLRLSLRLARDSNDYQSQKDVLTSWDRIGNLYLTNGDAATALENFAKSLPIAQQLAASQKTLEDQSALLGCYAEIGDAQMGLGSWLLAHAAYQKALKQYDRIQYSWPNDENSTLQAASVHGQLAYIKIQTRQPTQSIQHALAGLEMTPDQKWIAVNLVHGYVFSNQLQKAIQVCNQNKNVDVNGTNFKQLVLNDLNQFESEGLKSSNLTRLRAWLLASGTKAVGPAPAQPQPQATNKPVPTPTKALIPTPTAPPISSGDAGVI